MRKRLMARIMAVIIVGIMLGFYSLGLAIPMLFVAYSSHMLQSKLRALAQHEAILRYVSGSILIGFGVYSIAIGNIAF